MIYDFENLTMGHITATTPMDLKRYFVLSQDALPVRAKALHYVNVPSKFTSFYKLAKSFMSEKILKRVSAVKVETDRVVHVLFETSHPNEHELGFLLYKII
jgi:hypothetical protein